MQVVTLTAADDAGTPLQVEVTRKRVKNLNLRVHADGHVTLSAPIYASEAAIRDFLERKSAWIAQRVARARAAAAADAGKRVGGGAGDLPADIPLWGKLVPLEQAFGPYHLPATPTELERAVQALYKQEMARALPRVSERMERAVEATATRWSIRCMKTRWGSCTPSSGAIRINAMLAAYPAGCLEMVVAHELTHLLEPSHNARFHALLDTACPANRAISAQLRLPARTVAQALEERRAGSNDAPVTQPR